MPDSYALNDVSFDIEPGELVVITGPSGSGKTTIMKLLTKEYTPSSGEILFNDINISKLHSSQVHTLRRKIGVVFQDYKLIPELNIWENIALPLAIIGKSQTEIEERVTDLLSLVSLTSRAFHFPKQLSGGEAQRISIARALSTGPSVIFADEPTGNLDRENSIQIAKLLSKINSLGTTVIFATHDHELLDIFEDMRHIVLKDGAIESDSGAKKSEKDSKKENEKPAEKEDKESQPESKPKKQGILSRLFGKSTKTTPVAASVEDLDSEEDQKKDQDKTDPEPKKSEEKTSDKSEEKEEDTEKDDSKKEKKSKSKKTKSKKSKK